MIGSSRCSFLLCLVGVIALVLVFYSHLKTALYEGSDLTMGVMTSSKFSPATACPTIPLFALTKG